ncbi:hypothetical protein HMPREF1261_00627 [Corynebacterium sp. KPL1818]|nr:hypothetical protein HMPREF1261_00627 [Corynebacterium sp. KPL1818]
MVKPPLTIRGLQLISNGIPQGRAFPAKISPLVANTPTYLVSNSIIYTSMPINGGILSEHLEPTIIFSYTLISCSVTKSLPPTKPVIRLFNTTPNPMAVKTFALEIPAPAKVTLAHTAIVAVNFLANFIRSPFIPPHLQQLNSR